MIAEVLAIGDEILAGDILNSNAQFLSAELTQLGIKVNFHTSVRDDEKQIQNALLTASERADVVLVTGGLGPTADDFTLEMAASAFGVEYECHPQALQQLQSWYQNRNWVLNETNQKQAFMPKGSVVLPNPVGTAPAAYFRFQETDYYFLPGVPKEMHVIFKESIVPRLQSLISSPNATLFLKCFSLPESEVQRRLADLIVNRTHIGDVQIGFRVAFPEIFLKLSTKADSKEEAFLKIKTVKTEIQKRLGHSIYAHDLETTLEKKVVERFTNHKKTLAVAESCTGGLISNRITNVAGASEIFLGGLTTYANAIKKTLLDVSADTLKNQGAVSEECAKEMVLGLSQKTKADVCVATTGIAGPSGGSQEKPVGTVFVAFFINNFLKVKKYHFPFPREQFKEIVASTVFWRLLQDV